jgi:hypothetical protein
MTTALLCLLSASGGIVLGMVICGLLGERNMERHFRRIAARHGCPVCRQTEVDANTGELIDMQKYRERNGEKRIR